MKGELYKLYKRKLSSLEKSKNTRYILFTKSIPINTAGIIHKEYVETNRLNIPGSKPTIIIELDILLLEDGEPLLLENEETILL